MELLLIRHGRPRPERATLPGVGVDPPLDDQGRAEAALLGEYLTSGPGPLPDAVYTSPMRRARDTAAEITSRATMPVHTDDRLREFDAGATSYTPPELSTAGPAERRALWRALETGVWGDHRFDPDEFERRIGEAFTDIIAAHSAAVVAVVCHSGVINSFLGAVLQRPRGMFFQPGYTSISRVAASRSGRRQLLSLNETGHLIPARERSPR
jgi:2,3-bisphosphoglycerate-dependent phosphoglycerate mutase